MVAIQKIKNKTNFILVLCVIITVCSIIAAGMKLSSDAALLKSSPAYTVENRWLTGYGKTVDLSKTAITEGTVYHLDFDEAPDESLCIIFQSENMGISAYTSGKALYQAAPEHGKRYNIINIGEVGSDASVFLHLTPYENMTGKITSTVRLTSVNDFLFSLLCENIVFAAMFMLAAAVLAVFTVFTFVRLSVSVHSAYKNLYLILFGVLALALSGSANPLSQMVTGSSVIRYTMYYAALMLLTVPLTAYVTALTGYRHTAEKALQIGVTAYALLRLLLLALFDIPPERGVVLAYLLIGAEVLLCTVMLIGYIKEKHKNKTLP